jgi:drug/metabolite transporter (DMT)-like permease
MPKGRALAGSALYGALTFGAYFGFTYWGLQRAPAGIAGVFLATIPLITFALTLAHRQERFRWDKLLGAAIVVGGTAVIFRGGVAQGVPATSLLAILAGAVCAAEGAIVVKGFPPVHPAARNAIGMGVGTAVLLILTWVFGESLTLPRSGVTWASQAYLVVIGSIVVFALYLFVLKRWSASAASYEFVLVPVVGIILAAWLLDETVTSTFGIGALLVIVGVYVGALRSARHERAPRDLA